MATVPLQQTPTTTIDVGSPSLLPAQGQVATFETDRPREIQAFGQAMAKTGEQVTIIARKLQDELDDARSKELYNAFATELEGTTLEYMGLTGRSAVAPTGKDAEGNTLSAFDAAVQNLQTNLQGYLNQADNPRQQYMLRQMAETSIRSAASQMVRHSIAEQRRYADNEAKAQITVLAGQAGLHALSWNDPEGEFTIAAAAAIKAAEEYSDSRGWAAPDLNAPEGSPERVGSYQRQELINATWDTMHTSVLFQLSNQENYYGAAAYLESAIQNGTISPNTAMRFGATIQVGYDRQAGKEIANGVVAAATEGSGNANSGQFIDAANFVMSQSMSYAANGGNGPVRFGLSMGDGYDVGNMDRGQALEALQQLWAQKPANLPPSAGAAWLMMAANVGVESANIAAANLTADMDAGASRFASEADGLLRGTGERREQLLESIRGLITRQQVRTDENGIPMLEDLLTNVRSTVTDADQLASAEATITAWHSEAVANNAANYKATLAGAQDIAFARIGGWQDIPSATWAQIKPEDQALLREGPNRGDDPDTVLEIERNPALMLPGAIEDYRMLLSESTYLNFVKRGIAAQNTLPPEPAGISTDNAMFDTELAAYGFSNLVNPSNNTRKLDAAQLLNAWREAIDREQTLAGNRSITYDQKRQLLRGILDNRVRVNVNWGFDTDLIPVAMVDADQMESAYVQVGEQQVFLADIPAPVRLSIIEGIRNADPPGVVSELEIASIWVEAGRPRAVLPNTPPPGQ